MTRIPNANSPVEIRKAFQQVKASASILLEGAAGEILIGVAVGTNPAWGTDLTTLTSLTVDSISIDGAAITSDTGAISFDNENLTTTGVVAGINITSGSDPGHTHTIYSLVDGTRAFSGVVGGIDPVSGSDLATKDYVDTAVQEVAYTPDSITLNTGTNTGGNVASVQTLSDGNTYDVDEVTGVPGFDIEFDFSGVESFSRIWIHELYNGGAGHTVQIRLWNYDTPGWDVITTFTDQSGLKFIDFVVSDTNRIDGSGNARLSLYHVTNGNASHDIQIDYVAVAKAGFGSSNDHGALVGLDDDDHTGYHTDTRGDARYFQKSEFLNSSAGAGDAGKPIKLDASGEVDSSMISGGAGADEKVKIDAAATAGYLGAAFNDGVLRTNTGISYADGGDFVTLTTNDGQIVHDNLSGFVSNEHIDWTSASDNFSTSGTVTTGSWLLRNSGAVAYRLGLHCQVAANAAMIDLYSADGDGGDDMGFVIFAVGTPTDWSPYEVLEFRWDASETRFRMNSIAGNGGTVRPIDIYAGAANSNQLFLQTDGTVGINTVPDARFEVSTGAAEGKQAVTIDQNDADQAFIDYQGTSAANADNSITTWTAGNSIQGFIWAEINGVKKRMAFYDEPTS